MSKEKAIARVTSWIEKGRIEHEPDCKHVGFLEKRPKMKDFPIKFFDCGCYERAIIRMSYSRGWTDGKKEAILAMRKYLDE